MTEKAEKKAAAKAPARKSEPNETEARGREFEKAYRLMKSEYEGDPQYWQERQPLDVRHSAIQVGLRPTGEVSFEGVEDEGRTVLLRYSLPVEVAQGAESDQDYAVTHAKVSSKDQAVFEKAVRADEDADEADARMTIEDKAEDSTATLEVAAAFPSKSK